MSEKNPVEGEGRNNDNSKGIVICGEKKRTFQVTTSRGVKILSNLNPYAPEFYPSGRKNPSSSPNQADDSQAKSDGGKGEPSEGGTPLLKKQTRSPVATIRYREEVVKCVLVRGAETIARSIGIRKEDGILKFHIVDENSDIGKDNSTDQIVAAEKNNTISLGDKETTSPPYAVSDIEGLPFTVKQKQNLSLTNARDCENVLSNTGKDDDKKEPNDVPLVSQNNELENNTSITKAKDECAGDNSSKDKMMDASVELKKKVEKDGVEQNNTTNLGVTLGAEAIRNPLTEYPLKTVNMYNSKGSQKVSGKTTTANCVKTTPSATSILSRLKASRISRPIASTEGNNSNLPRGITRTITTAASTKTTGTIVAKKTTMLKAGTGSTASATMTATLSSCTSGTGRGIQGGPRSSLAASATGNTKSLSGTTKSMTSTAGTRSLLSTRARITSTSTTVSKKTVNSSYGNASSSSSATSNISTTNTKTSGSLTSRGATAGGITTRIGSALSAGSRKITDAIPRLMTARTSAVRQTPSSFNLTSPTSSSASSSKERLTTIPTGNRTGAVTGRIRDKPLSYGRTSSSSNNSVSNARTPVSGGTSTITASPTATSTKPAAHTTNLKANTLNRVS